MINDTTKLIHLTNINSLLPKRRQIRTALQSTPSTSILALCETKIAADYPFLPKYRHYDSYYSNNTAQSSGVVVYVNNGLPNQHLANMTYNKNSCMCSFVVVSLSLHLSVRVGVIYIHPN